MFFLIIILFCMELDNILNIENKNIESFCAKNNLQFTNNIKENLFEYYKLLIEWNKKINLTAITDLHEVYVKHFLDSLQSISHIRINSTLCDIGTGAGFPGLVIAIFRSDVKVTLVDALQKRVNFLQIVVTQLGLKNVTVLHNRAEDLDFKNKFLNSFDYVVSRAVAKLNTLVEYCLPFVKIGGTFIAYKSEKTTDEISESEHAIKTLGGVGLKVKEYSINDMYRTLIFIKKQFLTNPKYPRNQNKPRLQPL